MLRRDPGKRHFGDAASSSGPRRVPGTAMPLSYRRNPHEIKNFALGVRHTPVTSDERDEARAISTTGPAPPRAPFGHRPPVP